MAEFEVSPITTPDESREATSLARRVFGAGASLLLPRTPGWGLIARGDDRPAGGIILEKMGPREGLVSWIFVDRDAQGHRLGSRLLDEGIRALDDAGRTTQFALVRSDNTASWVMFARRGYTRPSVLRSLFGYSLQGFPKRLGYAFATGYSTWVRDTTPRSTHPSRWSLAKYLLFSVFIGAALSLFSLRGLEFLLVGLAVVPGVAVVRLLAAYPFARLAGPVRFDAPQGGTPLCAVLAVAFGAWWPTFGYFVPRDDIWRAPDFARADGLQSFAAWMSVIVVFGVIRLALPELFASGLQTILGLVIIYQAIPLFPFDAMDGARVLRHSRALYAVGVVATIIAVTVF